MPTFVSLFSGCGGFDLGFLKAGYECLGAYDNDDQALSHYRKNISDNAVKIDLSQKDVSLGIAKQPDVIVAGPPCQGFSTVGKRRVGDNRNRLLWKVADFAKDIRPKVVVVENVLGANQGFHKRYWRKLESSFEKLGYKVSTMSVNCSELGVPQIRKRLILFAWASDFMPAFEHVKVKTKTVRDALKNINSAPNHSPKRLTSKSKDGKIAKKIRAGQKLCNVRGGGNSIHTWEIPEVFGDVTKSEIAVLDCIRILRRRIRKRRVGDADPVALSDIEKETGRKCKRDIKSLIAKAYIREVGEYFDITHTFNGLYKRLDYDKPSKTVDTYFDNPRYFLHPVENRAFSLREAARIQGFPDEYVFDDDKAAMRLVGNAVPPQLGEFAARQAIAILRKL